MVIRKPNSAKPVRVSERVAKGKIALVAGSALKASTTLREAVTIVDQAMTAAKACPALAKHAQETVRDEYKVGYIAARLPSNGSEAVRIAHARQIMAMATSDGKGKLAKGQKRRTPEQQALYKSAGVAWSRILAETSHAPVKAASNGNKGKGRKGKSGQGKVAKAPATIELAKVAPFMPPARKDINRERLAAFMLAQAKVAVSECELLQQVAHKTGADGPSLDMVNAARAYKEAAERFAKA